MSDERVFLDTAKKVIRYVETVLKDPETGVFRGSQDADEEYYIRDKQGRQRLRPPKVDSAVYADSNAMMARALLKLWTKTRERRSGR